MERDSLSLWIGHGVWKVAMFTRATCLSQHQRHMTMSIVLFINAERGSLNQKNTCFLLFLN
jgi:hypothetical protein